MPGDIAPGDVYAINAPYNGGTHLPDITVCTPVFDDAGREHPVLGRVARPSRRRRRHLAGLDVAERDRRSRRKASTSTTSSWSTAAASARRSSTTCSPGAKYPARNPLQNVNDLKAQIAANEKGVQELRKMVGAVRAAGRARLHGARAGQRRRKRAPRHRPPARFAIRLRDGPGHAYQGEDHGRQEEARGDRRFHRHLAAAADQLQRARAGDARGRALRVPRHGRRRHPDERRLPAADQHRHPEALDAVAGISGRGGRRQCRDVARR